MNKKRINFANIISIFRLVFCLFGVTTLFFTFYHNNCQGSFTFFSSCGIKLFISLIIFLICAFSDFLDGYIARKYHQVSDLGKLLDPLVDKVLINLYLIVLVVFTELGRKYFFVLIVFLLRDYLVDFLRLFFLSKKIIIKASIYGKLKTIFQILFLIFLMIMFYAKENHFLNEMVFYLAIFACFFAIFSMINYFSQNNLLKNLFFIKKNDH